MATYIQGITDYIPQVQPFKPDFNFFQSVLQAKQAQYTANYNKLNNVYGKLLNSPLLREANIEKRNNFFTEIDGEIRRLAGVDLSLSENVQQASSLFKPLIDDKYFRTDISYTKSYQSQKSRGYALQQNPDPKSDQKFWQEGIDFLDYKASEFSKSTDDESLRFSTPRYVPFVNAAENLFKFAKDNDINPESVTKDGGYIFRYANGQQAIPKLNSVFSMVLKGDPRIKDMFNVQSYLNRKNYVASRIQDFGGDEIAAENAYLQEKLDIINKSYAEANKTNQERLDAASNRKRVLEEKIRTDGIDYEIDKHIIEAYRTSKSDLDTQTAVTQSDNEVLTYTDIKDLSSLDRISLRNRIDSAVSSALMDNLAYETAANYAMSKEKILDMTVDQYALEKVKHNYRMLEQSVQMAFDEKMKLMDIAGKMMENGGLSSPGEGMNPMLYSGMLLDIPGPGNVTNNDVDVIERNQSIATSLGGEALTKSKQNMEAFITAQNQVIATGTAAEKAQAEANIKSVLGVYNPKVQEATTYQTDVPVNIGQGLLGVGELILGGIGAGVGLFATPVTLGGSTVLTAAGAGLIGYGAANISEGFFGEETVSTQRTVTGGTGLAIKNSDGTYRLASDKEAPYITDPASGDYYYKANDRLTNFMTTNYTESKNNNASSITFKNTVDANNIDINTNRKLLDKMVQIDQENNRNINVALSQESGVTTALTSYYFTPDFVKPRSEQEFVANVLSAAKAGKLTSTQLGIEPVDLGPTSFEEFTPNPLPRSTPAAMPDEEEIKEIAVEAYEEIKEAYETLSKNPNANYGIKSYETIDPDLAGPGGINRFIGKAAGYQMDAAAYNTPAFKMMADFYMKDFKRTTADPSFMDENGVKLSMKGNGFNITRDDFDEITMEDSENAAKILDAFISSSFLNYGGKTGESVKRPTANYYLHSIATNDGNKVAMTWDISPDWVAENAGTINKKGITWALQETANTSGGKVPSITYFIDVDKAQSTPFMAMKSTKNELLMNVDGKLVVDEHKDYGGNIEFTPSALGGYTYTGVGYAFDQAGKLMKNPIFGRTDSDIDAAVKYWNDGLAQISQVNMTYLKQLSANSPNKVYNPEEIE